MFRETTAPLHALIFEHLAPIGAQLAPWIGPTSAQAAVLARGGGLDLLSGEELLALLRSPGDAVPGRSVLVTNRRLLGRSDESSTSRGTSYVRYAVPFEQVTGARFGEGSLLGHDKFFVHLGPRVLGLSNDSFARPLAGFLDVLARVPPGARTAPERPLVIPTPDDPTGASASAATMAPPDPRVATLLRLVYEAHRRDWADLAFARDLVARITLFHRNFVWGRGSRGERWWSPLSTADLGFLFCRLFGAPVAHGIHHGAQWLQFRAAGSGSSSAAVASTVVGLALFAVVGVGWVSVPRATLETIDVTLAAEDGATAFELQGRRGGRIGPLGDMAAEACARALESLVVAEAQILLLRALFGAAAPIESLFSLPRPVLEQRASELAGPTPLSAFG